MTCTSVYTHVHVYCLRWTCIQSTVQPVQYCSLDVCTLLCINTRWCTCAHKICSWNLSLFAQQSSNSCTFGEIWKYLLRTHFLRIPLEPSRRPGSDSGPKPGKNVSPGGLKCKKPSKIRVRKSAEIWRLVNRFLQ